MNTQTPGKDGHRSGSSMARSYASTYVVMLIAMGFLMAGIDNYAHAGGFVGGYLAGRILDPLLVRLDRPIHHRRRGSEAAPMRLTTSAFS